MLEHLLTRSCTVKGINEGLRLPQNLLSHHLKVLREAVSSSHRDVKGARYELAPGVEVGASDL